MEKKCPYCDSKRIVRRGTRTGKQRYRCKDCHKWFSHFRIEGAKILLFDIETAPMEVYVWQLQNNNYIHITQVIKDWSIICWRAKWLFDSEIQGACQTPKEAVARDDGRITRELWKLIDEADILIAHNLKNFDLKKANTKFLLHDLQPPSPFQIIDTLQVARSQFKMSSNKLDYLCQMLGIGAKLDTGFELWKGCLAGDKHSLDMMYKYCGQDTAILEDLYLKLRPWIKSHPNMGLYYDNEELRCANCGSENLNIEGRSYYTPAGRYQVYRCRDCQSLTRRRQAQKRDPKLLRSVAR